jgi:hypothetical protein
MQNTPGEKQEDSRGETNNDRRNRPPSGVPLSWWLVFIAVAVLVASIILSNPSTPANAPQSEAELEQPQSQAPLPKSRREAFEEMLANGNAGVLVQDQSADTDIRIDKVVLPQEGFVAIHADAGGVPGAVVATSGVLSSGEQTVTITSDKALNSGGVYYAVVYVDDGDGVFQTPQDTALTDEQGSVVSMSFLVSNS